MVRRVTVSGMGFNSTIGDQRSVARWSPLDAVITDGAHTIEKHVGCRDGNAGRVDRALADPVRWQWYNPGWTAGGSLLRGVDRNGFPQWGVFLVTELMRSQAQRRFYIYEHDQLVASVQIAG